MGPVVVEQQLQVFVIHYALANSAVPRSPRDIGGMAGGRPHLLRPNSNKQEVDSLVGKVQALTRRSWQTTDATRNAQRLSLLRRRCRETTSEVSLYMPEMWMKTVWAFEHFFDVHVTALIVNNLIK